MQFDYTMSASLILYYYMWTLTECLLEKNLQHMQIDSWNLPKTCINRTSFWHLQNTIQQCNETFFHWLGNPSMTHSGCNMSTSQNALQQLANVTLAAHWKSQQSLSPWKIREIALCVPTWKCTAVTSLLVSKNPAASTYNAMQVHHCHTDCNCAGYITIPW